MTRQRRTRTPSSQWSSNGGHLHNDLALLDEANAAPRSDRSSRSDKKRKGSNSSRLFPAVVFVIFAGIVILAVAYFLYLGYMETRINTPIAAPKVVKKFGLAVPERYWGTYRPGVYFGTRTRHPTSLVTGMMWFVAGHFQNNMLALRHWCDQGDDLSKYGWEVHDGRYAGVQKIVDKHVILQTSFVKRTGGQHGGDWSARIIVLPKGKKGEGTQASILYYVALDPDDMTGLLQPMMGPSQSLGSLKGMSDSVGGFRLHVVNSSGEILHHHVLSTKHMGLHMLKETVYRGLRVFNGNGENDKFIGLAGEMFSHEDLDRQPNFVVYQVTGQVPFEIEIVYESDSFFKRPGMLIGETLTDELGAFVEKFHSDFKEKFALEEKGFSEEEVSFAKAALSNMIGGIGYFYGSSKVLGEYNSDPVPYWKAPLYTSVPSRSFFPRGFLWDEGFHNLLISKWDREISQDILAHWFDLMNWDGWIPREQILGLEARARVPDEFVVQRGKNANPPTLLLTLHSMMSGFQRDLSDDDYEYLSRLWPRLRAWYNWFNSTQYGDLPGTYRWRGRDHRADKELNPKTLTSGLDDYPRASHPTVDERHLDLRCWMTLASGLMADIAKLIEKDPSKFEESNKYLSDNNVLDALHWSYAANGYMDYGLHTDSAELKKLSERADMKRIVHDDPKLKFIDSFGYVSFFPLFLQIIDPYSAKLGKVLDDLRQPDLLWTSYGLRSLAKNSPFYKKRNTEHDPPYWRGAIWINMNFLAIRALHHYSSVDGPHRDLAREIYVNLRGNVVKNVLREYKRTGYLWEHYSDKNGRGEGCRPFTGWSALVVLIMGETF
ncbi:mannosyl-oligosaccharide glucosidase [Palaemon carinicauda]|uniref:mannosyl-oligosaccharide glucosidase n=1 Tax=Palaemon carinicauda TaxID=392227 RepID=UPI0035B659BF